MSPPGSICAEDVRKVFPYRNPDPNSNSADMWVPYVLGLLGLARRADDPFAAERGDTVALGGVSLEVRPGEFLAVLGPNGAGKTTLVKILATTLRPTAGRVVVNGYDLARDPAKVRASLAVVMSVSWGALDAELTVAENLVFWGRLYGLDRMTARERAARALAVVGLSEWGGQRPGHLSAGMRQRLAIARGLLLRSPVFILDEPTVNIDPVGAYGIRDFLRNELNRGLGQTVLLTTHDMAEAEQLADRVAIVDRGELLAHDSPVALVARVGDRIIELSVTACTPLALRVLRERGVALQLVDLLDDAGTGRLRVHLRDGAAPEDVRGALEAQGVRVEAVRAGAPNLEDVFFRMAGRGLGGGHPT